MTTELAIRIALGLAAVAVLAWPFVSGRFSAISLATNPSIASDAHTVMAIALRLKETQKDKSAAIARSLIESMLTE